jgi:hypothetical protein
MGIFSEYLENVTNLDSLNTERKSQLSRISEFRGGREILVYASAMQKQGPVSIDYDDRLAIFDQLSNLEGSEIDIILETPGGSAEIVEDIVKVIRKRFSKVGMIVPGYAKSAGTILVMAGDEILMQPSSALGPIDAQVTQAGKRFSAHAFLEGFRKIKEEAALGKLNLAYVPILQMISPGEIQSCENALKFAEILVEKWLLSYKFKYWDTHSSTHEPVTEDEKIERASYIAKKLCAHDEWLSHGRSITIDDLIEMGLKITDYSKDSDLFDALNRYYTLLLMSLAPPDVIKIIETPKSQIYKRISMPGHSDLSRPKTDQLLGTIDCPKCRTKTPVQISFKEGIPINPNAVLFPKNNEFICPNCQEKIDLTKFRKDIEQKHCKKIV